MSYSPHDIATSFNELILYTQEDRKRSLPGDPEYKTPIEYSQEDDPAKSAFIDQVLKKRKKKVSGTRRSSR